VLVTLDGPFAGAAGRQTGQVASSITRFREIADIPAGRDTTVYEPGWQSWSAAGRYRAADTSPRPLDPVRHAMGFRPDKPLPERGFQGEGLLAVDPGDGGPIRLWGAPHPAREVASIRAQLIGCRLVVSADGEVEEFALEGPLEAALGRWAEELGRRCGVDSVRSLPTVWCTWYQYFSRVREQDVLENVAAMDRLDLDVNIVQIDDGYQVDIGDWLERSPAFPNSLAELADRIRSGGRQAGIWTAPLLVGARSRVAAAHPDWLVGGAAAGYNWEQPLMALDITHPDAAACVQQVFSELVSWGFDYFKVDFMYAGAMEGRRRADCTGMDAYREAMRLIREAIGPAAILLGSGAPLLPSIGLYDAMRVSPDVGLRRGNEKDPTAPGQRNAILAGRARAFQHGRFWVNDCDCLIARPEMEGREAWAKHIERYGGLRASSDRLESLDAWGLETTRQLLRPSPTMPFELPDDDAL
jgi:alpha-galactosidase